MAKPDPQPPLVGRIISALVTACFVWLLITAGLTLLPNVESFFLKQQTAPYTAALANGDPKAARALFDRDIRNKPTDPGTYAFIARVCLASNKADLAREYLERGLLPCKDAPRPERAQLYSLLSLAYTKLETTKPQQQAILAAQRAMELDPSSVDNLNTYGYLLADNNVQLDEALLRTSQALQLLKKQPDGPETSAMVAEVEDSYGWALYKMGYYDRAVNALGQAVADIPREMAADPKTNGEALGVLYYHLGAAYRRGKNPVAARQALQMALVYAPNQKEAREELDGLKEDPPVSTEGAAEKPARALDGAPPPRTPRTTVGSAPGAGSAPSLPSVPNPKAPPNGAPGKTDAAVPATTKPGATGSERRP